MWWMLLAAGLGALGGGTVAVIFLACLVVARDADIAAMAEWERH